MGASDRGRILIVDDEEMIRNVIAAHLREQGYSCQTCSDGHHAVELASASRYDAVLSDIQMPGLDGISLIRGLSEVDPGLPIVIVTADSSFDIARQALQLGAYDYIVKPFPLAQLDAAIERALERRRLHTQNQAYQRLLEEKVREKTQHLESANATVARQARKLRSAIQRLRTSFDDTVTAMVNAIEARDNETRNHCRRARAYTLLIARRLGLAAPDLRDIGWGALLHDVGKIGVPDSILLKRGPLDAEEWRLMKQHPVIGYQMLRSIDFLENASEVVLNHHEKFDGSGYPSGRRGEEIPVGARCFSIADAIEAITSQRCYKPAESWDKAYDEVARGAGGHFDPDIAKEFFAIPREEFEKIRARYVENPEEVVDEAVRARTPQFRRTTHEPTGPVDLAAIAMLAEEAASVSQELNFDGGADGGMLG